MPIEWVRLTPYNGPKVIQLIQKLLQRLGIPDHKIVFVYRFSPIAYYADGQYQIVPQQFETKIEKTVLIPPDREVNSETVYEAMVSADPTKAEPDLTGLVEDDEFFIILGPTDQSERPCQDDEPNLLQMIAWELRLDEENRAQVCEVIRAKLESMSRMLSSVALPQKPLLE